MQQTLLNPLSTPITNSRQCFEAFLKIWKKGTFEEHERYYAIYLNAKKEVIFYKLICIGSHDECVLDIRRTLKYSFTKHSNYVIIAHNQTNGNINPSDADLLVTQQVLNIFTLLKINLVDHIIMTEEGFSSLKDRGFI
jgi:DNA repair protein RadC